MAWGIVVVLILQFVYKAWESRSLFTNAHLEMLNGKYVILLMVEQMSLSHQRLTNWNIAETRIFGCSNYFFHFKIGLFFITSSKTSCTIFWNTEELDNPSNWFLSHSEVLISECSHLWMHACMCAAYYYYYSPSFDFLCDFIKLSWGLWEKEWRRMKWGNSHLLLLHLLCFWIGIWECGV
jgi:hypothetical protein